MANEESELVPEFDLTQHHREKQVERKPIAFWIPLTAAAKYEELQRRSGHAYGRYLQKMIIESIDKVSKKYGI